MRFRRGSFVRGSWFTLLVKLWPIFRVSPNMTDPFVPNLMPLSGSVPVLDALPVHDEPILEALPAPMGPPPLPPPLPVVPRVSLIRRLVRGIGSCCEWLFGAAVLIGGLAVLAAIPILQFLSLGYLLEAGARVARSGRLRDGFVGVRLAARLGGIVMGSWLLLLPVRYVSSVAQSAQVIDPGGPIARAWRVGLFVLIVLTALHILAACARGGRLRYFFWPFNLVWLIRRLFRGGYYTEACDAVWNTFVALRLGYYLSLGFRGFVTAFAWLVIPVSLIALGRASAPIAPLFGFLGAFLLTIVLLYLPFLQMRMAMVNRLRAGLQLCAVRREFQRAPWAFAFAFFLTLLFALPLYLLKIEIVPAEAAWLPGLFFIVFIFPARLLTGWALARATRRQTPRHWFFRWTGRLPFLPVAAFYVLILYFTQFTSWNGVWSLYEQHAFLVPVPFFGG
jgi:hypothetical protein